MTFRSCAATAALVVLLACEEIMPTPAPDPTTSARASVAATTASAAHASLLAPRPLADALALLEPRLGKSPRVLELQVHADRLVAQVQDPRQPGNVDEYEVRDGTLLDPVPVKLIGPGKLEDNLFPLREARLEAIPALAAAALGELAIEGGKVVSVRVRRNLPLSDDVQLRVHVSGPRKDGYVDADKDGRIVATSE